MNRARPRSAAALVMKANRTGGGAFRVPGGRGTALGASQVPTGSAAEPLARSASPPYHRLRDRGAPTDADRLQPRAAPVAASAALDYPPGSAIGRAGPHRRRQRSPERKNSARPGLRSRDRWSRWRRRRPCRRARPACRRHRSRPLELSGLHRRAPSSEVHHKSSASCARVAWGS